jgi:calcineurin-like phosphoesterase family protein
MLKMLASKLGHRESQESYSPVILHISDTPWTVFPFIERLVKRFRPTWIVHTGDLVDGAKVGLFPQAEGLYRKRIGRIVKAMERHGTTVFLVMGNHDIPDVVRATALTSTIIEGVADLELGKLQVRVSHFPGLILEAPAPFNLFGHNMEIRSGERNGMVYLNGLEHAHLIYPATGQIKKIRYPWGTDDARLLRRRSKP